MSHILDDMNYIEARDRQGMLKTVTAFPEYCEQALNLSIKLKIDVQRKKYKNIVILGMGGSAIGGALLRDWLQPICKIPIIIIKQYTLPAFVDEDSLIFAVSYSGNTEETISSMQEAINRQADVIIFSSGGLLGEYADKFNISYYKFPTGFQPRAALPYQLFSLLLAAKNFGFIEEEWAEVNESLVILKQLRNELSPETSYEKNKAKQIAQQLKGYIPFVYGSSIQESVAYRLNTQLNENSKTPSGSSYFPEAFHNAIMAREADEDLLRKICVILLIDPKDNPNIINKIERFWKLVEPRFGKVIKIYSLGEGRLSRILSLLYVGDFVSVYLGLLYGKDPSTIDSINELKRK